MRGDAMHNRRRDERMRRAATLIAVAGVLMIGSVAPAQAITNGQPDGDAHPYVGLVTDFEEFVCSGALISPTVFVTAAHCFETPGQEVSVTVDRQGFSEDADFVTGHWFPDPEFCIACSPGLVGFDTHDVAVVVLDEPIAVSRYAQLPTTEQVQDFVTGGGPPQPVVPFTRYFAPVELVQAGKSVADEFIKVSANPSKGKGGTCFGDSGGPVLLGDTIVAVNSFVTNGLCRGVTYSYRLDTPDALAFVRRFL
jgi:Trypsin